MITRLSKESFTHKVSGKLIAKSFSLLFIHQWWTNGIRKYTVTLGTSGEVQ